MIALQKRRFDAVRLKEVTHCKGQSYHMHVTFLIQEWCCATALDTPALSSDMHLAKLLRISTAYLLCQDHGYIEN